MDRFNADRALLELKEGNERFILGGSVHRKIDARERLRALPKTARGLLRWVSAAQIPACPPELYF